jgi:hypothetical protein
MSVRMNPFGPLTLSGVTLQFATGGLIVGSFGDTPLAACANAGDGSEAMQARMVVSPTAIE